MKFKTLLLLSLFSVGLLILIQGCGSAASEETIVSGQVINSGNGNPIAEATVRITSPEEFTENTTQTNENGDFSFGLDINETIEISLRASKAGFIADELSPFPVNPETDVTDLILELTSESDTGGDGGDQQVGGEPEGAAAIVLTGIANQSINIAETGDQVSSAFTFQVQDSAGRALNSERAVDVQFSILSGPGGGEELIPTSARTNAQGQVTSSLFSGNAAGPVQIQALIERPEVGLTIRSKPILIAIHGGFPDIDHFSIAPDKFNFEGYSFNNIRNSVTVIVGDQFSNPVKPGTVVYFSTTGGIIQGSGETDDDGTVTVDLISGDPRPNDAIAGSGGRPGYSTVTATTINENNNPISKDINIVFSTTGALISATCQTSCVDQTTVDIQPNGGASFTYTVTDLNGNPMAAGTEITVEAGQGMEVTGDADIELGNYLFPGPGATEFNFSIRDTDDETNDPAPVNVKISVTTPSGNTTTYSQIGGTRRKSR